MEGSGQFLYQSYSTEYFQLSKSNFLMMTFKIQYIWFTKAANNKSMFYRKSYNICQEGVVIIISFYV
jgi:hypothetical protein